MGADSPDLVLDNDLDRATKQPGWEELRPRLFLAPEPVRQAIVEAGNPPL